MERITSMVGYNTPLQSGMLRISFIVQAYHLFLLTAFFLLVIAFLVIYVAVYLKGRRKKLDIRHRLKLQYSDIIGQSIIAGSTAELNDIVNARQGSLQQWLTHPFARKVFIDELFRASKMISGDAAGNIIWLYNHFQLHVYTEKNLHSKRWNVVAKAIQRLAGLEQKQLIKSIYRFTNSREDHIRKQAQAAVVKLIGFEGLRFLGLTNMPIGKWQQLCLLHELSFHTGYKEVQLKKWMLSPNATVVCFALMLVHTYRCYQLHDDVIACMHHTDIAVKEEAMVTLKEIAGETTSGKLVTFFCVGEPVIQLRILQALNEIGTPEELAFLGTILNHPDGNFKLAAAKAIKSIRQNDGLEIIKKNVSALQDPWPSIIAHLQEEEI
ncbi:MAG: HEAT repeat domain-containing protein [Panacibacter sp.]